MQVAEDEVEVVELAGAPQVGRAVTPHPRIGRRIAPALDQLGGGPVLRGIPRVEQRRRDLGTAHLSLLAELPTARGPRAREAAVRRRAADAPAAGYAPLAVAGPQWEQLGKCLTPV